jgi:hypothetical protein
MTLIPGPTIVIVRPDTVATCILLLVYVNAVVLFDVGSTRLNGASPYTLAGTVNVPVTDVIGFTVNEVAVHSPLASFIATIVVVPPPTIVTVRPDIVATDVFVLVKVNVPGLFDEGSTRLNGASPKFLDAIV